MSLDKKELDEIVRQVTSNMQKDKDIKQMANSIASKVRSYSVESRF